MPLSIVHLSWILQSSPFKSLRYPGATIVRRNSTVEQHRLARFAPRCFVGPGERVEIGRGGGGIVYPLPQQRAAVDEIDGEAAAFVLVREVAPQLVIRPQLPRGLENKLYPALPDSRVSTTVKHREDNQLIRTNAEVH